MDSQEILLEMAIRRIADDKEFMAFYLTKYIEFEEISEHKLLSELNCSTENYYKLALCKAPDVNAIHFASRMNNISQYTGIDVYGLSRIIKRVNSIISISESNSNTYLLAARDKNKGKGKNNGNDDG